MMALVMTLAMALASQVFKLTASFSCMLRACNPATPTECRLFSSLVAWCLRASPPGFLAWRFDRFRPHMQAHRRSCAHGCAHLGGRSRAPCRGPSVTHAESKSVLPSRSSTRAHGRRTCPAAHPRSSITDDSPVEAGLNNRHGAVSLVC